MPAERHKQGHTIVLLYIEALRTIEKEKNLLTAQRLLLGTLSKRCIDERYWKLIKEAHLLCVTRTM